MHLGFDIVGSQTFRLKQEILQGTSLLTYIGEIVLLVCNQNIEIVAVRIIRRYK